MKKFFKQRESNVVDSTPSVASPENTNNQNNAQPPLPLKPPPLDETLINIKQHSSPNEEYEDDFKKSVLLTAPEIKCEEPTEYTPSSRKEIKCKKKEICKDFIRGSCFRAECRHRHEIDLEQLRDLFIFCHDYQNNVCVKPNCKFVHGSVFEMQKFYRTGEFPPELDKKTQPLSETKEEPSQVGSSDRMEEMRHSMPLATPKKKGKKSHSTIPTNFNKPPPQIAPRPEAQLLSSYNLKNNNDQQPSRSGNKRLWSDSNDGPSDIYCPILHDELRPKRLNDGQCASCKVLENRLKFAVDRLKEIMKSAADSELKMMKLEKKHKFLLQLASDWIGLTSARLNERVSDNRVNTGQHRGSVFSQIDLQHMLQQSSIMSDRLVHLKDDSKKIPSQQGGNMSTQLKHFVQPSQLYGKVNSEDGGNKAYLSTQQLMLQNRASSNSPYQMQSSSVNAVTSEHGSVRMGNMGGHT